MTKMRLLAILGIGFLVGFWSLMPASRADEGKGRLLRHVVLFTFTDDATPAQVDSIVAGFRVLPKTIPGIVAFEWGTNNSPEGLAKGHTHCFLVTFRSEKERDAYLPHPDHQAFVATLKPLLKDVTVVDYWTQE